MVCVSRCPAGWPLACGQSNLVECPSLLTEPCCRCILIARESRAREESHDLQTREFMILVPESRVLGMIVLFVRSSSASLHAGVGDCQQRTSHSPTPRSFNKFTYFRQIPRSQDGLAKWLIALRIHTYLHHLSPVALLRRLDSTRRCSGQSFVSPTPRVWSISGQSTGLSVSLTIHIGVCRKPLLSDEAWTIIEGTYFSAMFWRHNLYLF